MGDRVPALIEGQFVLQAPAKNRHSQYEQPKREQHGTAAILRRTAKNLHLVLNLAYSIRCIGWQSSCIRFGVLDATHLTIELLDFRVIGRLGAGSRGEPHHRLTTSDQYQRRSPALVKPHTLPQSYRSTSPQDRAAPRARVNYSQSAPADRSAQRARALRRRRTPEC